MNLFKQLTASDRISFVALVTSIAGLGISLYEIRVSRELTQRQIEQTQTQFDKQLEDTRVRDSMQIALAETHDKLSVRPILNSETVFDGISEEPGFIVHNRGVGPALIDSMLIFYKGNKIANWEALTDELTDNGESFFSYRTPRWYQMRSGMILMPGSSEILYSAKQKDITDRNKLRKLLERDLGVRIYYKSLYNEAFVMEMMPKQNSN